MTTGKRDKSVGLYHVDERSKFTYFVIVTSRCPTEFKVRGKLIVPDPGDVIIYTSKTLHRRPIPTEYGIRHFFRAEIEEIQK